MEAEIYPYSEVSKQLAETQAQLNLLTKAIAAEESKLPRHMPWLSEAKGLQRELTGAVASLSWVLTLAPPAGA